MNASLLSDRLWPRSGLVRNAVLAVLGSLLVAAAAQVNVPMVPVPMTLQSLAVLVIGAAYGARLGAATLALYALEGAVGLPVFAGFQSGVMLASFGYVLGFIAAAFVVGYPRRARLGPLGGQDVRRHDAGCCGSLCAGADLALRLDRGEKAVQFGLAAVHRRRYREGRRGGPRLSRRMGAARPPLSAAGNENGAAP